MWPDARGEEGRRGARHDFARLRSQMGDSEFISVNDAVFYLTGELWLDVGAFATSGARSKEKWRVMQSRVARNRARQLLRIYAGR